MFAKQLHIAQESATTLSVPSFLSERVDAYYRERVQNTWAGGHIMKGRVPDANALILSSNDYLALADHPAIVAAQVDALRSAGRKFPLALASAARK